MIRTTVRTLFWITVIAFAWYAATAVASQTAGGPLLAIASALLLWGIAIAMMRRRTTAR